MRFQLIDQVLEQSENRITAIKNVSAAEEYLADHFPGFAVLPGVMMLETMAQAGRLLLADQADGPMVIREVRNLRYGNMVRPGQALEVEVTLKSRDPNAYDFQGVGRVNQDVAVQGRFQLAPLTPR